MSWCDARCVKTDVLRRIGFTPALVATSSDEVEERGGLGQRMPLVDQSFWRVRGFQHGENLKQRHPAVCVSWQLPLVAPSIQAFVLEGVTVVEFVRETLCGENDDAVVVCVEVPSKRLIVVRDLLSDAKGEMLRCLVIIVPAVRTLDLCNCKSLHEEWQVSIRSFSLIKEYSGRKHMCDGLNLPCWSRSNRNVHRLIWNSRSSRCHVSQRQQSSSTT